MATEGVGNIRFIAVARVADRTIVATHGPKARMEDKAKMVLRSDRVADQKRLSINDREVGTIHYECDAATLYLVVTAESYPQRTAFAMLQELQSTFEAKYSEKFGTAKEHELSRSSYGMLSELHKKYSIPANIDKVSAVTLQVDQVKGMMQQNIDTVLQNKQNLDTLLEDSQVMAGEASTFSRTAVEAKNALWWKNMKLVICIVVLCVVLIGVVTGSVLLNRK